MGWTELLEEQSSLAHAIDLIGDRWSLMIIAGSLDKAYRFNDLEQSLGINRSLLSARLNRLCAAGILEKTQYQDKPKRYEYRLTESGLKLRPIIVTLASWGEENLTKAQTPVTLTHAGCGSQVEAGIFCNHCNTRVGVKEVTSRLNRDDVPTISAFLSR